ncbi:unnamed protein product [Auanema sp. JU1783]|nr:unnamed protein product [Auanema sp. JU1783]
MDSNLLRLLICMLLVRNVLTIPVSDVPRLVTSVPDAVNETSILFSSNHTSTKSTAHTDSDEEEDDEGSIEMEEFEGDADRDTFFDETLGVKQSPSLIESSFKNKKTFSCPQIKTDLITGTSVGDLSPEDVTIIAAMGDALSTGIGLWPRTNIEFRGAAFSIGGDATIDGLVTVPNILREFSPLLHGVSHGMGSSDQLPEHQLNLAESGATSTDLVEQAEELVRRLSVLREVNYLKEWVMIIITIGTEDMCLRCSGANFNAISSAIDTLRSGIPKAFVVLLGPLHVASMHNQNENLLSKRCPCITGHDKIEELAKNWSSVFVDIQNYVDNSEFKSPTFGVLAIPSLTITSRFPDGLFLIKKPLLSRRGHMYATKWLWNRLIAGSSYNLSSAILSRDTYFCPSTGCPYFRTTANMHGCQLLSKAEFQEGKELYLGQDGKVVKKPRRSKESLYAIACIIIGIAFFVVLTLGTIFYQSSKQSDHGRFDVVEPSTLKFEQVKKEEERNLLSRQNTRAKSTEPFNRAQSMSTRRLNSECERISIVE